MGGGGSFCLNRYTNARFPFGMWVIRIPGVTRVEKGHADNTAVTTYVGGNMEHGLFYSGKKIVAPGSQQKSS